MEISNLIKEYKNKTGISDDTIAQHLGVSRSTVSRWISGETKKIPADMLDGLSALMGIDLHEVITHSLFTEPKPILGQVKAGYDLFAEENYLGYEHVSAQEAKDGDYFLEVVGDSMEAAKIHDGDLVYVKATEQVNPKEIAVVLIGREEVTIKRVVKKDQMLILEAANPDYENRYFTNEEVETLPVQIIGKVIYSKTLF